MLLWVVRHAIAADASEYQTDDERPLTDKGRRKFRGLADFLARQDRLPNLVLSSSLVRAVQTAEILVESLSLDTTQHQISANLYPAFRLESLVEQINSIAAKLPSRTDSNMALVGHEPDMSRTVSQLTGGSHFDFGRGTTVCLEFAGEVAIGTGSVSWMLRPGLMGGR